MSRYVTKKHGLIIGSGNVFFYRDDDGKHKDFPAIVWAQGLFFPRHSTAHTGLRSLAEQFIWDEGLEEAEPTIYDGITLPQFKHYRWLRHYPRCWLEQNAPGYGVREQPENGHGTFFFAKRGHALAFVKMVTDHLDGMTYV